MATVLSLQGVVQDQVRGFTAVATPQGAAAEPHPQPPSDDWGARTVLEVGLVPVGHQQAVSGAQIPVGTDPGRQGVGAVKNGHPPPQPRRLLQGWGFGRRCKPRGAAHSTAGPPTQPQTLLLFLWLAPPSPPLGRRRLCSDR